MDEPRIAQVWYASGNDDADDPAYGLSPVHTGPVAEVTAWLAGRPDLDNLAVSIDREVGTVWASAFLKAHPQ